MIVPEAENPKGIRACSVSADAGTSVTSRDAAKTTVFKRFVFIGEYFLSMPRGGQVIGMNRECAHHTVRVRKGIFSRE